MSFSINAAPPSLASWPVTEKQNKSDTAPGTPAPANDPLANESTFLKLLVSQLQNQNPLNPTDGNQFVSQLTAYSQLEQLIGIRQNTDQTSTQQAATQDGTRNEANPIIRK